MRTSKSDLGGGETCNNGQHQARSGGWPLTTEQQTSAQLHGQSADWWPIVAVPSPNLTSRNVCMCMWSKVFPWDKLHTQGEKNDNDISKLLVRPLLLFVYEMKPSTVLGRSRTRKYEYHQSLCLLKQLTIVRYCLYFRSGRNIYHYFISKTSHLSSFLIGNKSVSEMPCVSFVSSSYILEICLKYTEKLCDIFSWCHESLSQHNHWYNTSICIYSCMPLCIFDSSKVNLMLESKNKVP